MMHGPKKHQKEFICRCWTICTVSNDTQKA